jgi:hypothetical protein
VFFDASARLLGWGYTVTTWNVPILLRAGSLASWNPDAWPLKQALNRFSDDYNMLPDLLGVTGQFMLLCYREIVIPELRRTVTASVLEHLTRRREGLIAVRSLLRALEQVLARQQALDLERNRDLVADIKAWLVARESGIPIL